MNKEVFRPLTQVQALIQTYYFAFVGIFGTPHLYRCMDRRANGKKGVKYSKNHWMNKYFPQHSFPIRMDIVHLEADRLDDHATANFKLRVPEDVMEEINIKESSLSSFACILCNEGRTTIEVVGSNGLVQMYSAIVSLIQHRFEMNGLKYDTEQVAQLIYYFYGLEKAPIPQPVELPTGKKYIKVRLARKSKCPTPRVHFILA